MSGMANLPSKILSLSALFLIALSGFAQQGPGIQKYLNVKIEAVVLDSLSRVPVEFASSYITKQGDSTILDFTMSSKDGKVSFDNVVKGKYVLYVEQLGYRPFALSFSTPDSAFGSYDLGQMLICPDPETLEAARVTGDASPITIIKDTVVYNAGSYKVGENAKLGELLSKMPGIKVEGSSVTVGGSPVRNITIGGRTFFLDDPMVAVNNIPARIVRNVKVYDKTPETEGGMVSDTQKETVMDVALKPEYEDGFFGNASASAAYEEQFLGNGDLMLSRFSPKEQITALANYKSVTDPFSGNSQVIRGGQTLSPGRLTASSGRERSALAGINLDTDRSRKIKLDGSVKYDYSSKTVADTISRSFISGGKLAEEEELLSGVTGSHAVSGNIRIGNKDKSSYNLSVNISGSYSRSDESSLSQTGNAATYGSSFIGNQLYGNASTVLTLAKLGKPGRFAMMSFNLSGEMSDGHGADGSISYKNSRDNAGGRLFVNYVEPLTEKLSLQAKGNASLNLSDFTRAADQEFYSYTDSYSSVSMSQSLRMRLTIAEGELYAGADLNQSRLRGDWENRISPNIEYNYKKSNWTLTFQTDSYMSSPYTDYLVSALDLSDPSCTFVGNPAMNSSYTWSANLQGRYNDRKKKRTFTARAGGTMKQNPTANLIWYDASGQRFSRPVSMDTPQTSISASLTATTPLDGAAKWMFDISPSFSGQFAQSLSVGSTYSGDITYEALSGWLEDSAVIEKSDLVNCNYGISLGLQGSFSSVSLQVKADWNYRDYRWAEESLLNRQVHDGSFKFEVLYRHGAGWEMQGKMEQLVYLGYPEGLTRPETILSLRVAKKIGPVNVSVSGADLLDSRGAFTYRPGPTMTEYTHSVHFGRTIMLGITLDFGKFSAMKAAKANMAASGMLMN